MSESPKTLTQEESDKILAALKTQYFRAEESWRSKRNHLLALFMLDAGLRIGETIQLIFPDVVLSYKFVHTLTIRSEIAKNKHERLIPLSTRLRESIRVFHQMRSRWLDFSGDDFIFVGSNLKTPLSARQAERIISAAAVMSIGRSVHPHVLRHTFGTRLMRVTNIRVVQQLLGHKNLSSTQIYTHPDNDDLTNAINSL